MKESIKALFLGKLCPFENCNIQNEEYLKIVKQLNENRLKLLKLMDNKILEEYDNLVSELSYYQQEEYFCQGFSLGIRLILDALTDPL